MSVSPDCSAFRTYIAIDLKSFYASVEAQDRGLDPLNTNLVVADKSRSEKTICLAVSPALKSFGVPGRPRLFEVVQRVKTLNQERLRASPQHTLADSSVYLDELRRNPNLAIDYLVAPPRMHLYMLVSGKIFRRYLHWVSASDVHVYSIDEVFIDATSYLDYYKVSARELAEAMVHDVYERTGITATAGIGDNLYLAKVAMDVLAKHSQADARGVRIAELTTRSYREQLWTHRPLTDFWRVGPATARKLENLGLYTMGDVARCSLGERYDTLNEDLLYREFGVGAELLIDHAWGWEPTTIADIKAFKPQRKSLNSGQVLPRPYAFDEALMVAREMMEEVSLDLVEKGLVTDQVVLTVGYDVENLRDSTASQRFSGETKTDSYGRTLPKDAHGTQNLAHHTSSTRLMLEGLTELFERIVDPRLTVRRIYISVTRLREDSLAKMPDNSESAKSARSEGEVEQLDLFTDYEAEAEKQREARATLAQERSGQEALIKIKHKFGKNAIFRGVDLTPGATALQRNRTSGGHQL